MKNNLFFIALFALILGLTGWFSYQTATRLSTYLRLSESTSVSILSWEVRKVKGDTYEIIAGYSFPHKNSIIEGKTPIGKQFPNPWAAEIAITNYQKRAQTLFFNPNNPHQAMFQKKFPTKTIVSLTVLLGALIYFLILGRYAYVRSIN